MHVAGHASIFGKGVLGIKFIFPMSKNYYIQYSII